MSLKMNIQAGGLVVLTALLAACGSTVKLDETSVSDAKPTVIAPAASGDASTGVGVKQVDVSGDKTASAGPQNIAQTVYFDFDSYVIKSEFQPTVEGHAKHLSRYKNVKVVIEGNTDERGGREYNLSLGQKRSEAVRRALELLGVSGTQVEAVSFGKEKPVDNSGTEEGMAKNRRAQFSYR